MSHFKCCCSDFFIWPSVFWWIVCYSVLILVGSSPSGWQVHFDPKKGFWKPGDFTGSWYRPIVWFWRSFLIIWSHFSYLHEKGSLDQWFFNAPFLITRILFLGTKWNLTWALVYPTNRISLLWLKRGWSPAHCLVNFPVSAIVALETLIQVDDC